MEKDFIRLQPNQMLLLSTLIAIGPATTYKLYQRLKEESLLIKIASITMVYPILDSLVKKGLAEIASEIKVGERTRKKYRVTGLGQRIFIENQNAYKQIAELIPERV